MELPPIPAGFELDAAPQQAKLPPLPPGFVLDQEMPKALPKAASPMDYAMQSFNAAQTAPQPTNPLETYLDQRRQATKKNTISDQIAHSVDDQIEAAKQRTTPFTRDNEGQFLRKPLGIAVQGANGKWYYKADPNADASAENYKPVLSNQHDILRDPETGERIVFERNDATRESMLTSLGRLALPFMATSAPTRLPGGIQATRPAVQQLTRATPIENAIERIAPVSQNPVNPVAPPAVPRTMADIQGNRFQNALRDLDAFREAGVRPSLPVISEAPMASVAMQLSETPFVGGPMRNALYQSVAQTRDAAERAAQNLTPLATIPEVGQRVQSGLTRFRGDRLADLSPDVLQGLNIEPWQMVRQNQNMSQGAQRAATLANRIRAEVNAPQTAETIRGSATRGPMNPAQTVPVRRTAADMSEAELRAIASRPANQTSFAARQEALYELADRRLPAIMKADETRNAGLFGPTNLRQTFAGIRQAEQAAGISGGIVEGRFGKLAEKIMKPQANMTLENMRAARTEIGRALQNFGLFDARLDRTQLKQMYGAISQDIENAYRTLANRARILTRSPGADRVSETVARDAERALYEFQRANRYTRAGIERMDRFMKVINAENAEQAAMRLRQAALSKGRGNIALLQTARSALRPEEWNDFAGVMVREMGRPIASAAGRSQEAGFSVRTFMTNWRNMTPEAQRLLFNNSREIDNLVRVANRLGEIEATVNSSRTATNLINVSGTIAALTAGVTGNALTAISVGIGALGMSFILSRPTYVRMMTGILKVRAAIAGANNGTVIERGVEESNKLVRRFVHALATDKDASPELARSVEAALLIGRATQGRHAQSEDRQPKPNIGIMQR